MILPILLGGWLVAPFHGFRGKRGWFAAGCVAGITLFTVFSFLVSWIGGSISWISIFLPLVLLFAGGFLVRKMGKEEKGDKISKDSFSPSQGFIWFRRVIFIVLGLILIDSMREVMHLNRHGLAVGFIKNFGDLGFHFHLITSFLFGDNFPPENPIFSGYPLRYPFLCDYYSSIFWFATGSMEGSVEIPGMVLGLSLLILFYQWVLQLTGSSLAGVLASLLLFLNGSMGWIYWFKDLFDRQIKNWLPRNYSMIPDQNLEWPNLLHALFVPQRGLQFAFPLVVLSLS